MKVILSCYGNQLLLINTAFWQVAFNTYSWYYSHLHSRWCRPSALCTPPPTQQLHWRPCHLRAMRTLLGFRSHHPMPILVFSFCFSVWPSSLPCSLGLCSSKSSWFQSLPGCTALGSRSVWVLWQRLLLAYQVLYPGFSSSTQAATGPAEDSNSQPLLELQIARGRWAQVGWEFWASSIRDTLACAHFGHNPLLLSD